MTTDISIPGFTRSQLMTIKSTVAHDTNDQEFNLFMEACRSYGLDPFRKQINAIVYNKDKPEKRKMAIILARDGLRVMAQRCGDYRPASKPADIIYDKELKGPTNPKGIVSATVYLNKQDSNGEWFPVVGEAYWDEFAPLKDVWEYDEKQGRRAPTGRKELDKTGNWAKMPILMITKCAEAQALRAGWPDTFGGVHVAEEMDREITDATASEQLEKYMEEERMRKLGDAGIHFVFDDSGVMERVAIGSVADRLAEHIGGLDPECVHKFRVRNTVALQEFWAHEPNDALAIKKMIEGKERLLGHGEKEAF